MKKKDAESINGTLEMLKRLAYSVHGVMDVVDYNNIKVAKQTMDKLADGYKICNVDNAMQIINSRDWLTVEKKGQDPFDFNSFAKLLFSANNIPRIKDKSGAVISRLVIVPFNAKFSADDEDYDPYIKYKLRQPESMEYLIQLGIAGLKRVLKRRKFTISEKVQKELEEYEETNNPILLFFKEEPSVLNEPTAQVYKKYSEFCLANTFTPMSNIEFSKQIRKHYNVDIVSRSIRGKKYRVFVKKEE